MAEETAVSQESADVDDISPEVLDQIIETGEADRPAPRPAEKSGDAAEEPRPVVDEDGKRRTEALETAVARLTEIVTATHAQSQAANGAKDVPKEPPTEEQVLAILKSQGLNDEAAKLFGKPIADSIEARVTAVRSEMRGEVDALKAGLAGLSQAQQIAQLETYIDSLLDAKGITDAEDRQEVKDLAKHRTALKKNAGIEDFRREFERAATRSLQRTVKAQETRRVEQQTQDDKTPPPGGPGKYGREDAARTMLKSSKQEDRPRGVNWTKLMASYIKGGGV